MVVKISCAVFAVAMGLAVAGPAHASIINFTTQSAYLAAIGAPGVDTFDDLSVAILPSPLSRTAGAYSYTASTPNDFFPAASGTDGWLSTNESPDPITFSNFAAGVVGIGGFFFGSDISGAFLPGQTIGVSATDADGTVSLDRQFDDRKFRVCHQQCVHSVMVVAVPPGNDSAWPTVNNLTLGVAPTSGGPRACLAVASWRPVWSPRVRDADEGPRANEVSTSALSERRPARRQTKASARAKRARP
jgi:hypothetical protein